MIVYITEEYLSILNEKKTASQYRKDKFKNTYDLMGRKGLEKLALRDRNISVGDDLKARSKALKDQKLKDSDTYK